MCGPLALNFDYFSGDSASHELGPLCASKQGQKRAGAAKPRKTAASPAPGHTALACGNAACGKALGPPLLQCFKCKAEAYCCKACQVGDPAAPAPAGHSTRRSRLLTHPRTLPSPLPAPPAPVQGQSLDMRRALEAHCCEHEEK